MRKAGKRTLAGMAAGALGLALIPFVGAGVSQAAEFTGSDAWATTSPSSPVAYLAGANDPIPVTVKRTGTGSLGDGLVASLAQGGVGASATTGGYPTTAASTASFPVLAHVRVISGSGTVFPSAGYQIVPNPDASPGTTGYVTATGAAAVASAPADAANPSTFGLTSNGGDAGDTYNIQDAAAATPTRGAALPTVSLSANGPAVVEVTVWADSNANGIRDGGENFATQTITFVEPSDVSVGLSISPNPAIATASTTVTATLTAGSLPLWNLAAGTALTLQKLGTDGTTFATATTTGTGLSSAGTFDVAAAGSTFIATPTAGPTTTATALSPGTYRASYALATPVTSPTVDFALGSAAAKSLSLTASGATFTPASVLSSVVALNGTETAIAAAPNNGPARAIGVSPASSTVNVTVGGTAGTPVQVLVTLTTLPTSGTGPTLVVNGSETLDTNGDTVLLNVTPGDVITLVGNAGTGALASLDTLVYSVAVVNPAALAGAFGSIALTNNTNNPRMTFTYAAPTTVATGAIDGVALGTPASANAVTVVQANNANATISGTVDNSFGAPAPTGDIGIRVTAAAADLANGNAATQTTTVSDGTYSTTVAGSAVTQHVAVWLDANGNGTFDTGETVLGYATITYAAAAAVTASLITPTLQAAKPVTLNGVNAATAGTIAIPVSILDANGSAMQNNVPVAVSVSGGPRIMAQADPQALVSTGSESTGILVAGGAGAITIYVASNTAGTFPVTVAVGGLSINVPVTFTADTTPVSLDIAPSTGGPVPASVPAGAVVPMTTTLKDANGNGVAGEQVQITLVGDAVLAGGAGQTIVLTTSTAGTATFTVIAGTGGGSFTVNAVSLAAPTVTGTTGAIAITGPVVEPSIMLEGDRQGRTIVVVGETAGIAEGTIVRPWIRFPGETSYTRGAAQRTVEIIDPENEAGEFVWQRRTGKRTAVIFRTQDESVSSTRIIIPAR